MIKQLAIVTTLAAGTLMLTAPHANAATTLEGRALSVAKTRTGDPYHYGSAGPTRFDCSGLVYYAFEHAGHKLPRTTSSQYRAVHHISSGSRAIGDLVFFGSTSAPYHVGIYVGSGKVLNANSGAYRGYHVLTAPISEYGSSVHYGRV